MRLNKLEKTAVDALEDIKARDIVVFDVRKLTSLYDTMILATAESARQTKALASNVQEKMKAAGGRIIGVEGEQSGEWVLVDCGDLVVHIMQPAIRQYYNLEELWSHAPANAPRAGAARLGTAPLPATALGAAATAADSGQATAPPRRAVTPAVRSGSRGAGTGRPARAAPAGEARARRRRIPAAGPIADDPAGAPPRPGRRRGKSPGDGS